MCAVGGGQCAYCSAIPDQQGGWGGSDEHSFWYGGSVLGGSFGWLYGFCGTKVDLFSGFICGNVANCEPFPGMYVRGRCGSTVLTGCSYGVYVLYCQLAASTHCEAMGSPSSASLVRALGAMTWSVPARYKGEGAEAPGVVDSVAEGAVVWDDEGFSPFFHRSFVGEAG